MLGIYWAYIGDNGKLHGNYYSGFRVESGYVYPLGSLKRVYRFRV